uniref:ATP-dependent RNA helicase n=1 Tax=Scophthalmus maximus TaxID=52904 RepID=A0A8D3B729_SCOMX
MSLFVVNRYLGQEEDGSVSKESRSQALLAKLQQKAKEKQRQSLTEPGGDGSEEQTLQRGATKKRRANENDSQEPRHHRKRKSEVVPSCEPNSENHEEPVEEKKNQERGVTERQKKKKKITTGSPADGSPEPPVTGRDGHEDTEMIPSEHTTETTSAPTGFTIVGGFENKPVQKVHRVLPQWLAQPQVIHRDMKNNLVPVSEVAALCEPLVKKLQIVNNYWDVSTVQAEVIPAILESLQPGLLFGRGGYQPRDICVSAPTGSGKTLAFVIPVIQVLMRRVVCEVRALAVLPTKELVCKVFTSFAAEQASLSEHRGGRRCSLADVVVATPGRLVDHINKNSGLCLEHLRFLIIDEADRMIDSMHQSWLSQVVRAVYRSGSDSRATSMFSRTEPAQVTAASLSPPQMFLQKLLFSATLTQNPEKLQQRPPPAPTLQLHPRHASSPRHKQDRFDFPQGLTHYVPCTLSKPLLILHFILRLKLSPILCFTNSRETAHRLFLLVQLFGGVNAAEFSSRLSPGERKKTLKEFEQGKIQLLVSTDAAARGIDDGVKCVVNYDAPQYIRTYIHRIGRTARAGKAGLAFTFLLQVQEKSFLQMVAEAGSPGIQKQIVKPENLQTMEARYEQTLRELEKVVKVLSLQKL